MDSRACRMRKTKKEKKREKTLLAVMYYWHYRTLCPRNLLGARVGAVAARLATYEYAASRALVCDARVRVLVKYRSRSE